MCVENYTNDNFFYLDDASIVLDISLQELSKYVVKGELCVAAWFNDGKPHALYSSDAHKILRRGNHTVNRTIDVPLLPANHIDKLCLEDLIIFESDLKHFQKELESPTKEEAIVEPEPEEVEPTQEAEILQIEEQKEEGVIYYFEQKDDCRYVNVNGTEYRLGLVQAYIFNELWLASQTDCPAVQGRQACIDSGSNTEKLMQVFRKNNIKEFINQSDSKGYYYLKTTLEPTLSTT